MSAREPSRVRDRTLLRMQLLVGAAAAIQSACSGDRPPEPKTDGAGPSGGDDGSAAEGGPSFSSGYMVVDPVPPPSRCGGEIAGKVNATALLRPSKLGNDVVVTLRRNDGGKVRVGPAEGFRVESGGGNRPVEVKEVGADVELAILFDGQSTSVYVNVPVICDADTGNMNVLVRVDPERQIPNTVLEASVQPGYQY